MTFILPGTLRAFKGDPIDHHFGRRHKKPSDAAAQPFLVPRAVLNEKTRAGNFLTGNS